jgi:hypothetical protein
VNLDFQRYKGIFMQSAIILFITFLLSIATTFNSHASLISIDFESLVIGDDILEQYADKGVHFNQTGNSTLSSPGNIVSQGFGNTSNALSINDFDKGLLIAFDMRIFSFRAQIFELLDQGGGGLEKTALVMFDFEGTDDEELTVSEGETVGIIKEVGEWLFVRKNDGKEGYIPKSYVQLQSVYLQAFGYNEHSELINLAPTQEIVVHSSGFWSPIGYTSQTAISAIKLWGTKDFKVDSLTINSKRTASTIPEPSTIILFIFGGLIILFTPKNRKQN